MIIQCLIVLGCLALGELIVGITGIGLPSSIVGMLLLTLFLSIGVVKIDNIKKISDLLISNLGLFFVPPGVALMLYFDIIEAAWIPIVLSTIISIIVVMLVTGWSHQWLLKLQHRSNRRRKKYD